EAVDMADQAAHVAIVLDERVGELAGIRVGADGCIHDAPPRMDSGDSVRCRPTGSTARRGVSSGHVRGQTPDMAVWAMSGRALSVARNSVRVERSPARSAWASVHEPSLQSPHAHDGRAPRGLSLVLRAARTQAVPLLPA